MSVTVIFPLSPDMDRHRRKAWEWVHGYYSRCHPGWQLLGGFCHGPWSKAVAVASALDHATGDVLVIADADLWVDPDALRAAVEAAETEPWAIPHEMVHRLDEPATLAHYAGHWLPAYDRKPYVGVAGGGIVALRRDVYDDCPLDPRFTGWGGEDVSWGLALYTLHGRWWRGTADLWHLYHTSAQVGRVGGRDSELLATAYSRAFNRPDRMRPLVEEGKRYFGSGTNAVASTDPAPTITSTQTIGL